MTAAASNQDEEPIVIYGASQHGMVVLGVLAACGLDVAGFIDDDTAIHRTTLYGKEVLAGDEWIRERASRGISAMVAVGNNDARVEIGQRLRGYGVHMLNALHPSAVLMAGVEVGTGNLICAGAAVVSGTRLGDDVVLNSGCTIDHGSLVKSGAMVSPGVHTAGQVVIGQRSFIGVGAILGPGVTIGDRSIVGAGSLVLDDIPPNVLAFGNPARVVRELDDEVDWTRILSRRSSTRAGGIA